VVHARLKSTSPPDAWNVVTVALRKLRTPSKYSQLAVDQVVEPPHVVAQRRGPGSTDVTSQLLRTPIWLLTLARGHSLAYNRPK
jgi:hypothetical protein